MFIKKQYGNPWVVIIGDFWESGKRDIIKEEVANTCGVDYTNLDEIKDNPLYQCGLNTVVYDSKGLPHTVEHLGVSLHPNDNGMRYIADAVITKLFD